MVQQKLWALLIVWISWLPEVVSNKMQIHLYCRVLQYIVQVLELEYLHLLVLPTFVLSTPYNGKKKKKVFKRYKCYSNGFTNYYYSCCLFEHCIFSNKRHNFARLLQNYQPTHCFINGKINQLFLTFCLYLSLFLLHLLQWRSWIFYQVSKLLLQYRMWILVMIIM